MKRLITSLFGLLFLALSSLQAQSYKEMMYDPQYNFYEVLSAAEAHFQNREKGKGSGWVGFERWRYQNEGAFFPDGDRRKVDPHFAAKAYQGFLRQAQKQSNIPSWRDLGPYTTGIIADGYNPGLGRVECFYVDPNNPQRLYLGSRSGGFWRSLNGGLNWSQSTTDFLVASGVNTMSVKPGQPDEVLVNIRNANNRTTHGIYRSSDGGLNWSATPFVPANLAWGGLGTNDQINDIRYHPSETDLLFVGSNRGLFRSADDLQSWTQGINGQVITQIKFHPNDSDVVYLVSNGTSIMKSTDRGLSFTVQGNLPGTSRGNIKLAVSPNCPDCLFAANNDGVWKSLNQGASFQFMSNPPGTCDGFAVSDLDTSALLYGMLDLYASTDGGRNFQQVTYWNINNANSQMGVNYTHADLRNAGVYNGVFYACTDGYLCTSFDNGQTWNIVSDGTGIRENYSLGLSQSNNDRSLCGSQDNGTSLLREEGWLEYFGADGMDAIIHPLNPDLMVGSWQYGGRRRSDNGGFNSRTVTPAGQSGAWVAPLRYKPLDPMQIYSFGTEVYRSEDFGNSWTSLGSPRFGGTIGHAALAENSEIMAVARANNLNISSDGGQTWDRIFGIPNSMISDIAFAPRHDSTLIITFSRHENDGVKVYLSHDLGQNWQNISYNLNDMPIRSVVIDHSQEQNIYLGGEIGLYTMAMGDTTWTLYNQDLPNCSMNDLEIMRGTNTLRGATWGRGLWETDLVGRSDFPKIKKLSISQPPSPHNPKASIPQWVEAQIDYDQTLSAVFVRYSLNHWGLDSVMPLIADSANAWRSPRPLPDGLAGDKVYFTVYAVGSQGDTSESYRFMYRIRDLKYCDAAGARNTTANWISQVDLANLSHSSSKSAYSDFTSQRAILDHRQSYSLVVQMNHSFSSDSVFAWVDWNHDYDFSPEEMLRFDPLDAQHRTQVNLTVPASAANGDYRLRIRNHWRSAPNPCDSLTGEVEDYTIEVQNSNVSLGENSLGSFQIEVFPNPAQDRVQLRLSKKVAQLSLSAYSLGGQKVWDAEYDNCEQVEISTKNWARGVYLLRWQSEAGEGRQKLELR